MARWRRVVGSWRRKQDATRDRYITSGGVGVCAYCFCRLTRDDATIDHVVPKSRGGTNDLRNLVISCAECNRQKGSCSEIVFRLWLESAAGIAWLYERADRTKP
jgi:5-methylcytosine-specific restriction endonuclease McrA